MTATVIIFMIITHIIVLYIGVSMGIYYTVRHYQRNYQIISDDNLINLYNKIRLSNKSKKIIVDIENKFGEN